ncbi:Uncharacterised protein [Serratia plymuthica]|nr:Uncharacterised protein [Serratia plymuthica]
MGGLLKRFLCASHLIGLIINTISIFKFYVLRCCLFRYVKSGKNSFECCQRHIIMSSNLTLSMLSSNIFYAPNNCFCIHYIARMLNKSMFSRIKNTSVVMRYARFNAGNINNQNAVAVVNWIVNRIVAYHMKVIAWPAWGQNRSCLAIGEKTRRYRKLPISRSKTHLGQLVNSSRSPIINFAGLWGIGG